MGSEMCIRDSWYFTNIVIGFNTRGRASIISLGKQYIDWVLYQVKEVLDTKDSRYEKDSMNSLTSAYEVLF